MRLILLLFSLSVLAGTVKASEDQTEGSQTSARQSFMVTIAEYQMEASVPVSASEKDLLDSIRKDGLTPAEVVRFTVLSDTEGMVQFGKQTAVVIGSVTTRTGTSRNMQQYDLGTLIKVSVSPDGAGVITKLQFESSRLQGEGTEDSPPDVATATISTSRSHVLGVPCLMGSTTADNTSYIFLTVTKLP